MFWQKKWHQYWLSSLETQTVSADWKTAHVTPILKKGEHYNAAYYRPVSLTSVLQNNGAHIIGQPNYVPS